MIAPAKADAVEVVVLRRRRWDRYPRLRGCVSKVLYTKARYARLEAERQGLYAYRCTYCKGWHLTKRQRGGGR